MNSVTDSKAGRGRVLLADDDALFRAGLAGLLRHEGYDCVCAADGAQALELLRQAEFEALISDIYMPGNIGLELIEDAPQLAAGLPVILLTGRPTVETAVKSVKLSVAGYLVKPPDLAELWPLLDKAVEGYRTCRKIAASRQRFETWARDLALVENSLRDPASADKAKAVAQYLHLMSSNFLSVLDDMQLTLALLTRLKHGEAAFREQEWLSVLQGTVQVLDETRRSFKSKRLARLRLRLQSVVEQHRASSPPGHPSAGPPET